MSLPLIRFPFVLIQIALEFFMFGTKQIKWDTVYFLRSIYYFAYLHIHAHG